MRKIILVLLLSAIVFADPNSVSSVRVDYRKIDGNTITRTEVTTYLKSGLEAEKAKLIADRDASKARIDARYQPMIDEINTKLELFE